MTGQNPNVGVSTGFYANNGTFTVAVGGNGSFGKGVGEVTYTSNNSAPVAEHQFGSSIWGAGKNDVLFNSGGLAGKTGIEMLVNVDAASTSRQDLHKVGVHGVRRCLLADGKSTERFNSACSVPNFWI